MHALLCLGTGRPCAPLIDMGTNCKSTSIDDRVKGHKSRRGDRAVNKGPICKYKGVIANNRTTVCNHDPNKMVYL